MKMLGEDFEKLFALNQDQRRGGRPQGSVDLAHLFQGSTSGG